MSSIRDMFNSPAQKTASGALRLVAKNHDGGKGFGLVHYLSHSLLCLSTTRPVGKTPDYLDVPCSPELARASNAHLLSREAMEAYHWHPLAGTVMYGKRIRMGSIAVLRL